MIVCMIIVILAFVWLGLETRWFTVRLLTGKIPSKQEPVQDEKTAPYFWRTDKTNMQICYHCPNGKSCGKNKDRWAGWNIPAKTIKAYGYTMNFETGCNVLRAKMLHDVVNAQRITKQRLMNVPEISSHVFMQPLCGDKWLKEHEHFEIPEPTIEISIDGKTLPVNGNYKKGLIAGFMEQYTERVRAGKRTLTIVKGGHVENMGGGTYVAINGELVNGEYQYF